MKPLQGRTVLDCTPLLPGSRACQQLRKLGARVIKIESADRRHPIRDLGQALYEDLNGGKEHVALDLTVEADRAKFSELVRAADGLIESYRPDTRKKLGLDHQTLHALNPKLCVVSITGFRVDGPHPARAGHDVNFAAITGLLTLFDGMPGLPLGALFTAQKAALVMSAMIASGKGGHTTVTIEDTLLEAQSTLLAEFRETGVAPVQGDTLYSGKYPSHRLYTAGDGRRVAVGSIEPKYWDRLCSVLGLPGLSGKQLADGDEGKQVIATIQAAFARRPWSEWAPLFREADCCVEPVREYGELDAPVAGR